MVISMFSWWTRDGRRDAKVKRLQTRYHKLKQEHDALVERYRLLEEENKHAGAVLARMRLHADAELREVKRKLIQLGFVPEEEAKRDNRKS